MIIIRVIKITDNITIRQIVQNINNLSITTTTTTTTIIIIIIIYMI